MDNFPASSYSGQNPPEQPGYPSPGGFFPGSQPTQPAFPPPQPGYPPPEGLTQPGFQAAQPGGFSQPGYPQIPAPRKRRTGLWIALVVILLLLAGGGTFAYLQIRSTPQKTLQAYCDALKNSDAQALYNTLSSTERARTSVSQLRQDLQFIEFLVGGVKDCTVDNSSIQENGSSATGNVTLTTGRGRAITTTVRLIEENGQWKIEENVQFRNGATRQYMRTT